MLCTQGCGSVHRRECVHASGRVHRRERRVVTQGCIGERDGPEDPTSSGPAASPSRGPLSLPLPGLGEPSAADLGRRRRRASLRRAAWASLGADQSSRWYFLITIKTPPPFLFLSLLYLGDSSSPHSLSPLVSVLLSLSFIASFYSELFSCSSSPPFYYTS